MIREMGPLADDHPQVGKECLGCGRQFVAGDRVTLRSTRPADDEEAAKADAGLPYISLAEVVHWRCAYGP